MVSEVERKRQYKREYNRRYRAEHRERENERRRLRYVAHREEEIERHRRYYAENRDKRPCVDCGELCQGRPPVPRCRKCANLHYRGNKSSHYKGGCIRPDGYRCVYHGRERHLILEHRLVWEAVHGKVSQRWAIHHLNGDKLDNRVENLMALPCTVHPRLHMLVAGGAFSLRQAAVEARQLMTGKAPTLAEARKTLRVQYRGDPGKQALYERKLLKPGWAGRMAPVERTYVLQVLYRATRKLLAAMPKLERESALGGPALL